MLSVVSLFLELSRSHQKSRVNLNFLCRNRRERENKREVVGARRDKAESWAEQAQGVREQTF